MIASGRRQWAGSLAAAGQPKTILADAVYLEPRATVDVALVLAVDSSGSISEQRLMMQIQGYLDALRHPMFVDAVKGGRHGRIGLTFVEWTDARRQDQVVGWRVIEDEASARQWIENHDAAAEWMSQAGLGAYPTQFVGRFAHLMSVGG